MRCAIVGAGMAGLACADVLARAGHAVALFDKGRGPGGRMATRRLATPLGEAAFDHGAQYFTVRDPGFRRQVDRWHALKIVERWPLAGGDAWVGRPGMNAVVKHTAASHAVTWRHRVTGLVRRDRCWRVIGDGGDAGPFDAAVLAIPAEQAATILSLHDFALARVAHQARSQPCWASMFAFDRPLDTLAPIIRSGSDIAWASRNSAKPGRTGPEAWVVQANASWTQARIDCPPAVIAASLHTALSAVTDFVIPDPIAVSAHLWRYALSAASGDGALWRSELALGVCGDWLLGPRVECAWLSGVMLAKTIIAERDR